tara:strand:+ start:1438 stop:1839 length:402 start_codon:yes stop_codon:yes gene_type:complete
MTRFLTHKEFMEMTDHWSYTEKIAFLLEDSEVLDSILKHIECSWNGRYTIINRETNEAEKEDIYHVTKEEVKIQEEMNKNKEVMLNGFKQQLHSLYSCLERVDDDAAFEWATKNVGEDDMWIVRGTGRRWLND